jgi:hypothetical protein
MRAPSRPTSRRLAAAWLSAFFVLILGGAVAGCSGDHAGAPTDPLMPAMTPAAHASAAPDQGSGGMIPSADAVATAWAMRPGFVSSAPQRTQAAYAFALARPDVVQWLPCYCGCGAMGHTSNLDCFIKPTEGAPVVFEEHGSYCDVCVETALMAQGMLAKGGTLIQMRAAVDASFGDLAPGTPTELPPG